MPDNFNDDEGVAYLSGKNMSRLLNAEQKATEVAMTKNLRPSMTITLPGISEFNLGQLIYMLEVETAFIGELYNINAFDQPGVELGKILTFAMMGRRGYAEKLKQMKMSGEKRKYII
jgi:glucose-6-phosphate isomerase